jgi:predicted Zn-dependent protease
MDRDLLLPRWVLAAVAERQGAWEEARNHLRDLLARMDADHPMAARVRDRLEFVERSLPGEGVR